MYPVHFVPARQDSVPPHQCITGIKKSLDRIPSDTATRVANEVNNASSAIATTITKGVVHQLTPRLVQLTSDLEELKLNTAASTEILTKLHNYITTGAVSRNAEEFAHISEVLCQHASTTQAGFNALGAKLQSVQAESDAKHEAILDALNKLTTRSGGREGQVRSSRPRPTHRNSPVVRRDREYYPRKAKDKAKGGCV